MELSKATKIADETQQPDGHRARAPVQVARVTIVEVKTSRARRDGRLDLASL